MRDVQRTCTPASKCTPGSGHQNRSLQQVGTGGGPAVPAQQPGRQAPTTPAPTTCRPAQRCPAPSGAAQYVHTLQSPLSLHEAQHAPGPSTMFLSPDSRTVPACRRGGAFGRCRRQGQQHPAAQSVPKASPPLTVQVETALGVALPAGGTRGSSRCGVWLTAGGGSGGSGNSNLPVAQADQHHVGCGCPGAQHSSNGQQERQQSRGWDAAARHRPPSPQRARERRQWLKTEAERRQRAQQGGETRHDGMGA